MTSHIDVIVLHKHKLVAELRIPHQFCNLLQHTLSGLVERMSLAGKHELHGAIRIIHHGSQALDVGQDQIRPLICGKTTRKSDGKSIRTQHSFQALQLGRRFAPTLCLLHGSPPDKLDQLRLQIKMSLPKLAVIHAIDAKPDFCLAAPLVPVRAQVTIVKTKHLRRQPRRNVHAVGDVPNRNVIFKFVTKQFGPHRARHFRMQR